MNPTVSLEEEGGVTQFSLRNARILIEQHGLPATVELHQPQNGPNRGEHLVDAVWSDGTHHTFNGFSWGYGGEGPHGLEKFLAMIHITPPISIGQIATWPQDHFPALTFVRGEDYDLDPEEDVPEPDHDDTIKFCPDCERPNQFGELCLDCTRERQMAEDAGEPYAPVRYAEGSDRCAGEMLAYGIGPEELGS